MTQPPNDDPFFRPEVAQANANLLLPLCQPVEEAILLDTAYRKRMRHPPGEVGGPASNRYFELVQKETGLQGMDDREVLLWSYLNLADLLWNRLTEQEQYQWLLRVK